MTENLPNSAVSVSSSTSPTPADQNAPPPVTSPSTAAKPKKTSLVVFLVVILVLLIGGGIYWAVSYYQNQLTEQLAKTKVTNTPTLDRIRDNGKLIIATDATFPPMEYLNEQGSFVGYDIELGTRIADQLGVVPEFRNVLFDDIFTALENREVDIVMSGVTITNERKLTYDFSNPYLNAGQVIITRKDTNDIRTTTDLQGKRIAVQRNTTNEEQAYTFTAKEFVLPYDDFQHATIALLNGEADAIFSDLTGAKGIINENSELKISSDPFTDEEYGIVFRKGEEDLVSEVNTSLEMLRQQGVLVFLKQKWLE